MSVSPLLKDGSAPKRQSTEARLDLCTERFKRRPIGVLVKTVAGLDWVLMMGLSLTFEYAAMADFDKTLIKDYWRNL